MDKSMQDYNTVLSTEFNTNPIHTISSLEVAEMIGKEHKYLLRDIRRYEAQMTSDGISPVDFFQKSSYVDAKGESRHSYNITRQGCDFIGNKVKGAKGTAFTALYVKRFHEMAKGDISVSILKRLDTLEKEVIAMRSSDLSVVRNTGSTIVNVVDDIGKHIESIEKYILDQVNPSDLSGCTKYYNPWFFKMNPKYKALMKYFNVSRMTLYNNIVWELGNIYGIDTDQVKFDYCCENNVQDCYPLDPYQNVPERRKMVEDFVNSVLVKHGISINDTSVGHPKRTTIFNTTENQTSAF